jgi:hypothetical protein
LSFVVSVGAFIFIIDVWISSLSSLMPWLFLWMGWLRFYLFNPWCITWSVTWVAAYLQSLLQMTSWTTCPPSSTDHRPLYLVHWSIDVTHAVIDVKLLTTDCDLV